MFTEIKVLVFITQKIFYICAAINLVIRQYITYKSGLFTTQLIIQ